MLAQYVGIFVYFSWFATDNFVEQWGNERIDVCFYLVA